MFCSMACTTSEFCSREPRRRKNLFRARPLSGDESSILMRTRSRNTPVGFSGAWVNPVVSGAESNSPHKSIAVISRLTLNRARKSKCNRQLLVILYLKVWTSRELQEWQPDSTHEYLVRSDGRIRSKTAGASRRDQVILVHTVATDPDCTY